MYRVVFVESPEGVKWGSSRPHWDWDLVTGNWKNVKIQKREWHLRIAKWDLKKNELGNGIGTPLQDSLCRTV